MTALSDAVAAAGSALTSSKATADAVRTGQAYGGTADAALATRAALCRQHGAAIKAAGGDHLQAGLLDTNGAAITANNGWVGRTYRTHGTEGVEGCVIAGVDHVAWNYELNRRRES